MDARFVHQKLGATAVSFGKVGVGQAAEGYVGFDEMVVPFHEGPEVGGVVGFVKIERSPRGAVVDVKKQSLALDGFGEAFRNGAGVVPREVFVVYEKREIS